MPREHDNDSIRVSFEGKIAETRRQEDILSRFMDLLQDFWKLLDKSIDAKLLNHNC